MMKSTIQILRHAWLALLVLLWGCAPKTDKELLGSYEAKLPAGEETLNLVADGVCQQEIRLRDGKRYFARGHWEFDPKRSRLSLTGTRVSLNGFGDMNPDIAEIPIGGTGSLPVTRGLFGGIEIGLGESVSYHKVEDAAEAD